MTRFDVRAVWFVLLLCSPLWTHAQSDGPWEKGSLQIGGFFSSSSTELRLDSETLGFGTVVDLEDTLGISTDKNTYRIDAFYRLGDSRRHQIEFHYYNLSRSGSNTLDSTVQIGDVVFPVGTGVNSEFKLRFANLDYSYAFLQNDRWRLAVAGGLHTTGINLKVQGSGGSLVEEEDFTAPLPVVGLRGDVVLAERWRLKASADAFYLSYGGANGTLTDIGVAVEYLAFKNVGFGLGVNSVRIKVEAESDNSLGFGLNGELTYSFIGGMAYVKAYF